MIPLRVSESRSYGSEALRFGESSFSALSSMRDCQSGCGIVETEKIKPPFRAGRRIRIELSEVKREARPFKRRAAGEVLPTSPLEASLSTTRKGKASNERVSGPLGVGLQWTDLLFGSKAEDVRGW